MATIFLTGLINYNDCSQLGELPKSISMCSLEIKTSRQWIKTKQKQNTDWHGNRLFWFIFFWSRKNNWLQSKLARTEAINNNLEPGTCNPDRRLHNKECGKVCKKTAMPASLEAPFKQFFIVSTI